MKNETHTMPVTLECKSNKIIDDTIKLFDALCHNGICDKEDDIESVIRSIQIYREEHERWRLMIETLVNAWNKNP